MTFYYQSVETHVERLLRKRRYQLALAAYVAWVADKGHVGEASAQLDGYVPLRLVAVDVLAVGAESSVDGAELTYPGIIEPLKGTYPQVKVGAYGVFHQYRNVAAIIGEGVGDFLHCERVGCRARTRP